MYPFSDLASNKYWNQNDNLIAQKFYIVQCLHISAASDYAVGLQLMDTNKLNWSTTANYYSIVHGSRLIVFIAIGDFPTRHNVLSDLFAGNNRPFTPRWARGINLRPNEFLGDWLQGFAPHYTANPNDKDNNAAAFSRQELCKHYREVLKLVDAHDLIQGVGIVLDKAKELRNDSNYEALLMAHEYMHVMVSDSFKRLSKTMADAAKFCLKAATKCFKHYLEFDSSLAQKREAFKYFVSQYTKDRIYNTVRYRCGPQYVDKIKECIKELEDICPKPTADVIENYAHLEHHTSMEVFGQKTSMMRDFDGKIKAFEENIRSICAIRRQLRKHCDFS